MKSLLDPTFKYTRSDETDLRETFRRVRREQELAAVAERAEQVPPFVPVQIHAVKGAK